MKTGSFNEANHLKINAIILSFKINPHSLEDFPLPSLII